jgi:hypothetical protein
MSWWKKTDVYDKILTIICKLKIIFCSEKWIYLSHKKWKMLKRRMKIQLKKFNHNNSNYSSSKSLNRLTIRMHIVIMQQTYLVFLCMKCNPLCKWILSTYRNVARSIRLIIQLPLIWMITTPFELRVVKKFPTTRHLSALNYLILFSKTMSFLSFPLLNYFVFEVCLQSGGKW